MVSKLGIMWRKFVSHFTGWEKIGKRQVPRRFVKENWVNPNKQLFESNPVFVYKIDTQAGMRQGEYIRKYYRTKSNR